MNRKKKYILLGVIGVSCFSLLLIVNSILLQDLIPPFIQNDGDRATKQFSVENITLFIDYSGVKTNEEFENINLTNYQTTVYDLLLNCCEISIQVFGGYIYVNGINGVGTGWIYTVNDGAPPNMPSDYFNLLNNDVVKWKHVI
ncbi:MAG: DUF4430 domain-containing protein [Candidatus Lokiarchaeota archaeon]|nr:DUF4430 domain-containing protein [Candidatus Lokiarchaeota archaeon]